MKPSELLCDESKWCKYFGALDAVDLPVGPTDPLACRWCLIGAVFHTIDGHDARMAAIAKLHDAAKRRTGSGVVSNFNDNPKTTFQDIQEILQECDL